jgi:hypothetical protein
LFGQPALQFPNPSAWGALKVLLKNALKMTIGNGAYRSQPGHVKFCLSRQLLPFFRPYDSRSHKLRPNRLSFALYSVFCILLERLVSFMSILLFVPFGRVRFMADSSNPKLQFAVLETREIHNCPRPVQLS